MTDNGDAHVGAIGLVGDAAASDSTSAWSIEALLKGVLGALDGLPVLGTAGQNQALLGPLVGSGPPTFRALTLADMGADIETIDANSLTGTTLAAGVKHSSLQDVGTLSALTVTATITGSVSGNAGTATTLATARAINGVNFDGSAPITVTAAAGTLSGTTLNATVVGSSLTSVGTLASLAMGGTLTMGANTLALASATVSGTPTWSSNQAITLSTAAQTNITSLGTLTALTVSGQLIDSANGAASTPALTVSGAPFAGTGTTSFPQVYINDSAATASTTLNTAGTYFGVNGHGTTTRDFVGLYYDGVLRVNIAQKTGIQTWKLYALADGTTSNGVIAFATPNNRPGLILWTDAAQTANRINIAYATTARFTLGFDADNTGNGLLGIQSGNAVVIDRSGVLGWNSAADLTSGSLDNTLQRLGAHSMQWGAAASATPNAFTLQMAENYNAAGSTASGSATLQLGGTSLAATSTNSPGGSAIITTGLGTGNAAATTITFQTAVPTASGTGAQSLANSLVLSQPSGASTTSNFLNVTGTLPSTLSAGVIGIKAAITGAGNSGQVVTGFRLDLLVGYTGSSATFGAIFENDSAGTGTGINASGTINGNAAYEGFTGTTTTGDNFGAVGIASGGGRNFGNYGASLTAKNSATNIGVVGFGLNTGGSPIQIGGYFGLHSALPTFASAALIADNGSTSSPVFLARVNGTTKMSVDASGHLNFADAINAILGTSTGTQIATAANQMLAFHGSTAVVQRAGAAQAAVVTTGSALASYGYTQAQADSIVTLLNELRAALVEKGLIKGSA